MFAQHTAGDDLINPEQTPSRPGAAGIADGPSRAKTAVTISAKPPSMIIVTQPDDVSIHRSTEDSKSETEDRDYSETESSSVFLTDTESEHHVLVSGKQSCVAVY